MLEHLAVALVTKSATVKPDEARKVLQRARSILLELRKSGPLSDLGQVLADGLPADGQGPTFSNKSDAQAAMKEGEAAFARRDFAAARKSYQQALTLDPGLYDAALFVGDTYFAPGQLKEARTWFNRAILIDPNKETAHRYLGDTLVKGKNLVAARLSYIDAIIAEPFSRRPWMGLGNWARANHTMPQHPRVVPEELDGDGKKANLPGAPPPAPASPTTAAPTGIATARRARPGRRTGSRRPSSQSPIATASPRRPTPCDKSHAPSPPTSRPAGSSSRTPASPTSSSSIKRGSWKPISSSPGPMRGSLRIMNPIATLTAASCADTSGSTSPRSGMSSRMPIS